MPNYVKHKVTFAGNKKYITEMLESIRTDTDGSIRHIDFNKIIPMPESLNITSGSETDIGVVILRYIEYNDSELLNERLSYSWTTQKDIKTLDDLVSYYRNNKNYEKVISLGRLAIDNIDKYGHQDWYGWACENWGTKWNSGSTSMRETFLNIHEVLEFETAWSTPMPVMLKLSENFPGITFKVQYADEDIGSNCGEYILLNGKEISYLSYDGIKACEVWGYDPADYFPEILRDRQIDKILNDNK